MFFISLAAWALLFAKFLTSCATTANPRPASPAVAASTAAFRDKIFVWNAIWSITSMATFIELTWVFISSIDSAVWFAKFCPFLADVVTFWANCDILFVAWVFACIVAVICSSAAAVSSRDAACWFDDADRLFEAFDNVCVLLFSASPVFITIAKISEVLFPTSLIPAVREPRLPYIPSSLIL